MRIVYLSNSVIPSRSANSIHVMKMCQAFAQHGHSVTLLAPRRPDVESGVRDVYGFYGVDRCFDVVKLPYPAVIKRSLLYALTAAVRACGTRPDLVYGRSLGGTAMAGLWGCAVVYESHRPDWRQGRVESFLFRRLAAASTFRRLVVITDALRREYLTENLIAGDRIMVVPDSADEPKTHAPLSRWPGREGALQVGYVGHLYRGKGMEVVATLAREMPGEDFHVIGGTEDEIGAWKKRGLPGNLKLHGFVEPGQVTAYLSRLEVCLLPTQRFTGTYTEAPDVKGPNIADYTSPLKMFEYMAHGKAIVASDLPVLREVLNEDNALLVQPEDVAGWVRAIGSLRDPSARRPLAARARTDFTARYSWKRRARSVLEGIAP